MAQSDSSSETLQRSVITLQLGLCLYELKPTSHTTLLRFLSAGETKPIDVPAPPGISVVEAVTMAKGGYPVDVTAQTSSQPDTGCDSAFIGSEPELPAVAQFTHSDFPASIAEVIRPMELAELADILPSLSLLEEETPGGPDTPSVMDVLESFGLGIGDGPFGSGGGTETFDVLPGGDDDDAAASDAQQVSSRAPSLRMRSRVEWDRPAQPEVKEPPLDTN